MVSAIGALAVGAGIKLAKKQLKKYGVKYGKKLWALMASRSRKRMAKRKVEQNEKAISPDTD